jgi:predicted transcriptional regulator
MLKSLGNILSAKLKKEVLKLLKEKPLTLKELAEITTTPDKKMFRIIRSLFEKEKIDTTYEDGLTKYEAT